ncbi:hypothetical protein BSMD_011570 [Bacillus subtilis Miyagi-4]|nr:hypothetical protein BSNT_08309 [Bacillus subtilis subsp. natto BEST195]GAK79250.1 hypothetical protein BSMD_011570 [Bacillus subtilis Miyagi-4]
MHQLESSDGVSNSRTNKSNRKIDIDQMIHFALLNHTAVYFFIFPW